LIADWKAAFNRHEMNPDAVAFASPAISIWSTQPAATLKANRTCEKRSNISKERRRIETVDRIRFIRPDVALVDGSHEFTGTELRSYTKGVQTWVLTKENGR
jgi:hypothetical protein